MLYNVTGVKFVEREFKFGCKQKTEALSCLCIGFKCNKDKKMKKILSTSVEIFNFAIDTKLLFVNLLFLHCCGRSCSSEIWKFKVENVDVKHIMFIQREGSATILKRLWVGWYNHHKIINHGCWFVILRFLVQFLATFFWDVYV